MQHRYPVVNLLSRPRLGQCVTDKLSIGAMPNLNMMIDSLIPDPASSHAEMRVRTSSS